MALQKKYRLEIKFVGHIQLYIILNLSKFTKAKIINSAL